MPKPTGNIHAVITLMKITLVLLYLLSLGWSFYSLAKAGNALGHLIQQNSSELDNQPTTIEDSGIYN